ncbi:MAG: hypothetical protein JWN94_1506 [Betaproteobacteria bacterium]|nr:hypothetical protein [Betaproteobacteria bacterium]
MSNGSALLRASSDEAVIPVVQEELDVGKRRVETGSGVRVSKTVASRDEAVDVPLLKENVDVQRVAINRPVDAPPAVRYEGEVMIVPIIEEVLVVEKRLMLKEEIRITRHQSELREPQHVTLRSEHAEVERIGRANTDRPARDSNVDVDVDVIDPGDAALNLDDNAGLLERKRREDEEHRRDLHDR